MTDLRKAAELALTALENGTSPNLWSSTKEYLRQALAQPEQEPVSYKEECWACGCEDCICATKVPGYTKQIIEAAVLAEREACWNILFDYASRDDLSDSDESLLAHLGELIKARSEK